MFKLVLIDNAGTHRYEDYMDFWLSNVHDPFSDIECDLPYIPMPQLA